MLVAYIVLIEKKAQFDISHVMVKSELLDHRLSREFLPIGNY